MLPPTIELIRELNLGSDSKLELVLITNKRYIIKTYLGLDALIKKNREVQFHNELNKLGLRSFQFYYSEFIKPAQICIEFIEDLELFVNLENIQYFILLSKYMANLRQIGQSKIDYDLYYDWLIEEVKKSSARKELIDLGINIIEEFRIKKDYLTLLHSDFHDNNIGLVDGKDVLLFDSGHCPYIFGHRYHDLSRLVMYYPNKLIFENEQIWPKMVHIRNSIEDKVEFQKFCYINSLMNYDNTWIPRVREIADHLFLKFKE